MFAVLFIGFEIVEHTFLAEAHHGGDAAAVAGGNAGHGEGGEHLDGALITKLSVLSVMVNAIGPLVFFGRYVTRRSEHVRRRQRSLRRQLRQLLVENVPCLVAFLVGVLAQMYAPASLALDLIGAAVISAFGAYISYPLAIQTGSVLLCTTPFSVEAALKRSLREACTIDGVLECLDQHFWTFSPGCFVGTLKVCVCVCVCLCL
jgi:Co/Zn/Cd efflux system component